MDTGFKDPIGIKSKKELKNPINFDQPPYDQRSSCYQNAGTFYGVGKKTPTGSIGNPKTTYGVPMGRVNTLEVSHIHRGNSTNVDFEKPGSGSSY
jgi:hypothetical protein